MRTKFKLFLKVVAGTLISAIALNVFLAPMDIAPGGISGLAIAINHLTRAPLGIIIFALNIPIFIWAFKHFGASFIVTSLAGMILLSLFVDALGFLPKLTGDILLSAIYGGVLLGLGIGLVFSSGYTTGGTDIIVHILKSKHRRISVGKLVLIIDAFIIAFAGLVFKKWETLLYSAISLYISAFIIDLIVEGGNSAKIVYIISKNPALIASAISAGIGRGTTSLHASSFFSNTEKSVLMCVVKNYEITRLKNIVKNADNLAFVILSDAREVLGNGFENY
ncbi:MAG: YitT family protein [Clostridia bacterium]|nr:YitT family protein [Clostridia bacterium]